MKEVRKVSIEVEWNDNGSTSTTVVTIECSTLRGGQASLNWREDVLVFSANNVRDVRMSGPAIPQGGGA